MERINKKVYFTDINDIDYFNDLLGVDNFMLLDKNSILKNLIRPSINDNVINYLVNIESVKKLTKLSRHKKIQNIVFMLSLSSPDKIRQDFVDNVVKKLEIKPSFEFFIVSSGDDLGPYTKSNFSEVIVRSKS